jgi:uncharacterized protein (TIGR02996 family)
VKETPQDEPPRLVLADWLEEHGDGDSGADRAAFIRAPCRAAALPDGDAEKERLCVLAGSRCELCP